ncbi:MAG: restriction endonuclease [Acidobacteriaceae bacterium]
MDVALEAFIGDYKERGVPPPHILLVGKDEGRNASVAQEFAEDLGVDLHAVNAAEIKFTGDLTALLTIKKVALISNIQNLKGAMRDALAHTLENGEVQVTIGTGPTPRIHTMKLEVVALIGTCPAKHECPAPLLRQLRCVIPVELYTTAELQATLEAEAAKDRISFEPGAAELLVQCSNGLSSVLLNRFRKVVTQIDQKTNQPHFTVDEVSTALAKLRIEVPSAAPQIPLSRDIDDLTGQEFEALIKALLTQMGFEADLTAVTGDGGIDIIATLDRPFSGGRYIFQCKRYAENNLVGAPAIRDFYGAVTADKAIKGIFITTSDFTAHAKEFAEQTRIELVNRAKLMQLLEQYS